MAGCGGKDFEPLDDGRATGPGFAFELSEDWEALEDLKELRDEVGGEIDESLGLDVDSGFEFAGAWAEPDEDDTKPVVNVVVEPVTRDTKFEALSTGTTQFLQAAVKPQDLETGRSSLGGTPAFSATYETERDDDRVENRQLTAQRGDYAYTLTVQMHTDEDGPVDDLMRDIRSSWRWEPLRPAGRRLLAELSDFSGTGYTLTLPPGWRGTGPDALRKAGQLEGVDSLWRGYLDARRATNVNVGYIRAGSQDLDEALDFVEEQERTALDDQGAKLASLERGDDMELDGETAGVLELETDFGGDRLRQVEVVVLHDERLYRITLSGIEERHATDRKQFLRALRTWRWAP